MLQKPRSGRLSHKFATLFLLPCATLIVSLLLAPLRSPSTGIFDSQGRAFAAVETSSRSASTQGLTRRKSRFIYRFYPVAFGRKPDYVEFIPDLAKVSGFLSDTELEAAKVAFITKFMSRPAFVTEYNPLNDTQYVDTLLATADVTSPHRDFWIAALGNGTRTRATVLREITESPEVDNKYYNQAFVVMQYFGYLRRDPDALYLDWIQVLETTGDFRGMVNGFMNSLEYRFRFGQ